MVVDGVVLDLAVTDEFRELRSLSEQAFDHVLRASYVCSRSFGCSAAVVHVD